MSLVTALRTLSPAARRLEFESYAKLKQSAERVMPRILFHDMVSGAGRSRTSRANEDCYDAIDLIPRAAVGWPDRSLATTVLGQR
jgi:isopentenyl diphosphate isomerase/L-lactate dehydrogenase-like FMN-dependent dehydrogenase